MMSEPAPGEPGNTMRITRLGYAGGAEGLTPCAAAKGACTMHSELVSSTISVARTIDPVKVRVWR